MRDAVFGREEAAGEGEAGVAAGEVAGFGGGREELEGSGAVDGQVVDGFVGSGGSGGVGGCGEHGGYGFEVGGGEGFTLVDLRRD